MQELYRYAAGCQMGGLQAVKIRHEAPQSEVRQVAAGCQVGRPACMK